MLLFLLLCIVGALGQSNIPSDLSVAIVLKPTWLQAKRFTDMCWIDSDTLLMTQKLGTVQVWQYGQKVSELDFTQPPLNYDVNDEGDLGVVSCAIHPITKKVYVAFVHNITLNGKLFGSNQISSFDLNPDGISLNPSSEQILLGKCPGPSCSNCNGRTHCIDQIQIGPDNMLYVSIGENNLYEGTTWLSTDGAPPHIPNNGSYIGPMDPYTFEGKILRIDPDTGKGLPDNPWAYDYPFPGFTTSTTTTRTTKTTTTSSTKTTKTTTTKTSKTSSTKSTTTLASSTYSTTKSTTTSLTTTSITTTVEANFEETSVTWTGTVSTQEVVVYFTSEVPIVLPRRNRKRGPILKPSKTTKPYVTTKYPKVTTPKPSWTVPLDQQGLPFGEDWRSKVYVSGLRNPWSFTFVNNNTLPDLVIGDVGWAYIEAMKQASAGWNLGWPCTEGRNFTRQFIGWKNLHKGCFGIGQYYPPIQQKVLTQWDHLGQSTAIVGMAKMGNAYPSAYRGAYAHGDYVRGLAWAYQPATNKTISLGTFWGSPIRFKVGPDGLVYILEGYTNTVRRLQPIGWVPSIKSKTVSSTTTATQTLETSDVTATSRQTIVSTSTPPAAYCNPPFNQGTMNQLKKLPDNNPLSASALSSVVYLSQIPPSKGVFVAGSQQWLQNGGVGHAEMDSNNGAKGDNDGVPMTINGRRFVKGVGVHVSSVGNVNLGGYCTKFMASVGVDDLTLKTNVRGSVRFLIIRGETNAILYDSFKARGAIYRNTGPYSISVDVTGVKNLTLMAVRPQGVALATPGMDVDWGDARFACGSDAPFLPIVTMPNTNPIMAQIGETITLKASAIDFRGAKLPASSISWEIFMTHCQGAGCHVHPGGAWQGRDNLQVTLLDHPDCITYTARATAVDACGRVGWATWDLRVESAEPCCKSGSVGCSATSGPGGLSVQSFSPGIPKELAADGQDHGPGDVKFRVSESD